MNKDQLNKITEYLKENVWRNGRTVIIPKAPVNTPPGDIPATEAPVEDKKADTTEE